jgi:hypothetical protein
MRIGILKNLKQKKRLFVTSIIEDLIVFERMKNITAYNGLQVNGESFEINFRNIYQSQFHEYLVSKMI